MKANSEDSAGKRYGEDFHGQVAQTWSRIRQLLVDDYSSGRRSQRSFADLAAAKVKAAEIVDVSRAQVEVSLWDSPLKLE